MAQHIWGSDVAVPAAILFAVLYTIDAMARGLAWAEVQARAARGSARDAAASTRSPAALALALALPAQALAADEPKTDPTKEFLLEPWIEIPKIGPIDLSITKGVFYLFLSTAILLDRHAARRPRNLRLHPKRLQAFVEIVYDFSETQIGRASLPAEDVHDVVPVPGHAVPLHLDQQHHLVPAAAGGHGAQDLGLAADAELLRGDLEPLGHARAHARHVLRHALRRHQAQRRARLLQELVPADLGPDQAS